MSDSFGIPHTFLDSSVGTVTRLRSARPRNLGLLPDKGKSFFAGHQPPPDSMNVVGTSLRSKASKRVVDSSPPSTAVAKN
jgi:hypothetical protein